MKIPHSYRIAPHSPVKLSKIPTNSTGSFKSEESAVDETKSNVTKLGELQELFYASSSHGLLIVLQGMDAAGKDGTIGHIFTGVNPQGCDVAQFKVPTPQELSHDFLWRIHAQAPARGMIKIFNRSQYEDVLVTRVHRTIGKKEVKRRYDEIVNFEKMLAANNIVVLKFFLHISHREQTARLKERLDDPNKLWKLSPADLKERKFWKQYQSAYEEAIEATSREHAPWFVIPADHKWYRNVVISKILVETLQGMNLSYPRPEIDPKKVHL